MNPALSAAIRRMRMLYWCALDLLRGRRIFWQLTDRGWEYLRGDFEDN